MKHVCFIFFLFIAISLHSQELLSPSYGFSHKKTSYVTLKNGNQIVGTLKDIDRKKGLIDFVNIEDGNGKKHKLKPESISHMYLPPTGFDNLVKAMDAIYDAQKWNEQKLNEDLINQGYVYFENAKVKIKKKEMQLLMQLLNPSFCERLRVYHDPFAKETTSLGVGGITVVGGLEKSYYVKTESTKAAFLLTKKDYKKQYDGFWDSCPQMKKEYPVAAWSDFTKHIHVYNGCKK